MSASRTTTSRARAAIALAASALALGFVTLVLPRPAEAAPAAPSAPRATTCDTAYGCPTSSTGGQINPTCSVSPTSGSPGTKVTGTISNIPEGTEATLLFDGSQVGKKTAGADGKASISFTIPSGTSAGSHTLVFSGAGFSCDATAGAGFQVSGTSTNRGGLSKTGINVATYLAISLVLLVAGAQLVHLAQRRRRHAAARARRSSRSRQSVRS